jgi:hypothetical protein
MNHYSRLTREQPYTLEALKRNGAFQKEIAGPSASTQPR